MNQRRCTVMKDDGSSCRAAPLLDADFCLMHSPEHAAEVAEARRLGGFRRRREATLRVAYDLEQLETAGDVRRVVEIAILDVLGLDNSLSRAKALASLSNVALRAIEVADLEARISALEAARDIVPRSPWDDEDEV